MTSIRLSMLLAAGLGCGSATPSLRRVPPGFSEFVVVPRPPPVVPVEIQPPRPREDAVWIEGQWSWEQGRFRWDPGAWVIPPPGAGVSVWTFAYQQDGSVRFWPVRWLDAEGQPIQSPPPLASARTRIGLR